MSNNFERAFDSLYRSQTRNLNKAIVATVGAFATNKPAILSTVADDDLVKLGYIGQQGGYQIQMKVSDFSSDPTHQTAVTVNGDAENVALVILSWEKRSSIFNLIVGDPAA